MMVQSAMVRKNILKVAALPLNLFQMIYTQF